MEFDQSFVPQMDRAQSLPYMKTQKVESIYRINKKLKLKDDQLPFTKAMIMIKSPKVDSSQISKCNDILQQTYYNTAFPPNRKPLEKLKVAPTLATTNPILEKANNTKYCQYSVEFDNALKKQMKMENAIDSDISQSIQKTSTVDDFYKNYGYFLISKTSQNYANTIESLANHDKSNVQKLEEWFSHKVIKNKLEGSDYKQAIQHDKMVSDPEQLLKSPIIQNSDLLSATTQQLKSILKQKGEIFQPNKQINILLSNQKTKKQDQLPDIKTAPPSNTMSQPNFVNQQSFMSQETSNDTSDILKPLGKKQLWEMKDKATHKEVLLQYTVSKLEELLQQTKHKLESMRKENFELTERISNKYSDKLLQIKQEFECQNQAYNETISEGSRSKLSGSLSQKKKGKVEDFMKVKAIRDQLNERKNKILVKIDECNKKIKENQQKMHMVEFEVEQIKRDIQGTKQEQIQHYQNLLKEGIDARKDGLIWIIKAIWLIGQDAPIEYMPRFLDSETIKFLLEYAKLDIKRTEIHEMLKEFKLRARMDRISNVFKQKAMNTTLNFMQSPGMPQNQSPERRLSVFNQLPSPKKQKSTSKKDLFTQKTKESLLKQTKQKLHQMSQTLTAVNLAQEDPEELEILMQLREEEEDNKSMNSDFEEQDKEGDDILPQIQKKIERASPFRRSETLFEAGITEEQFEKGDQKVLEKEKSHIEKIYNQLKNKMRIMKNKELDRIGKQFLLNNYEKRFKVSQEIVFAAIVGEEKAKSALANQLKRINEYKRVIEKNRTFTFSSLRQSTQPWKRQTIISLKQ